MRERSAATPALKTTCFLGRLQKTLAEAAAMTTQEEVLVKALISMIQADGEIEPQETNLLGEVLGQLDLPLEDVATAGKWIMTPQAFDKNRLVGVFSSPQERKAVIDIMQRLIKSDGVLDKRETALLMELSDTLAAS